MPELRQGHQPCSGCGRYASEWVEIDGTRWAVTASHDASVKKGESWTCVLCRHERDEWDRQIEEDVKEGRLDDVIEEARRDYREGNTEPLFDPQDD